MLGSRLGAPVVHSIVTVTLPETEAGEEQRRVTLDIWYRQSPSVQGLIIEAGIPIVFQLPGWVTPRNVNERLALLLANRGLLVIAADDIAWHEPYADPADEAARVARLEIGDKTSYEHTLKSGARRVQIGARILARILDVLKSNPRLLELPNSITPDVHKIGIMGFSFGGATAVGAASSDQRITAVVNLDGWLFGEAAERPVPVPYLVFSSSQSIPTPAELSSSRFEERAAAGLNLKEQSHQANQVRLRPDALRFRIEGSDHADFTDSIDDWTRLRKYLRHWPKLPRAATVKAILDDHIVAFFAAHLLNVKPAVPDGSPARYPFLRRLGAEPLE